MKNIQIKKARGFTLVELVIVIAVLGILAAIALPRFANISSKAKTASKEAVIGAINSGIALARAQYIASGSPTSPATVRLDNGTVITMTQNGLDGTNTCQSVVDGLLQPGHGIGSVSGNLSSGCILTNTAKWDSNISIANYANGVTLAATVP